MIVNNLAAAFKKSVGWYDLANSLDKLNSSVVEPLLVRLKALPNLYEMHPDDLQVRLDELGANFSIGVVEDEDVPLLLQQRTDEIQFKDYEYSFSQLFKREFKGVVMHWEALYAPRDLTTYPYGSKFILYRDIISSELDINDYFLTQRAVIFARLDMVRLNFGDVAPFEELLHRVIPPLMPVNIAFDGQQYYLESIILTGKESEIVPTTSEIRQVIKPALDTRQQHEKINVTGIEIKDVTRENSLAQGRKVITKNVILFDDYPLDLIPLDTNFNQGLLND